MTQGYTSILLDTLSKLDSQDRTSDQITEEAGMQLFDALSVDIDELSTAGISLKKDAVMQNIGRIFVEMTSICNLMNITPAELINAFKVGESSLAQDFCIAAV